MTWVFIIGICSIAACIFMWRWEVKHKERGRGVLWSINNSHHSSNRSKGV